MSDTDIVRFGVEDGIAGILLNRPGTLNAWTAELAAAFYDTLDEAAVDPSVKVIVVTGAGVAFCSGDAPPDRAGRSALHTHLVPKPILAAINGRCAGAGLALAMRCDLRFAAADATFSALTTRRWKPAEDGLSWILPRVVGAGAALDVLLSGRTIAAEEALRIGLVHAVVEPEALMQYVLAYAGDLVANADLDAMAAVKAQVWRHLEVGLEQAIEESDALAARFRDLPPRG